MTVIILPRSKKMTLIQPFTLRKTHQGTLPDHSENNLHWKYEPGTRCLSNTDRKIQSGQYGYKAYTLKSEALT